ncbi:hypothetical protein F5888DRAFT_1633637 [Russula emetica]|nr:hypothetical protein F5888DRAFT_1633637 [Russula emetica]
MRGPTALFLSTVWTLFFVACRFHHVVATTPSPFFPQITWERGSTAVGPNPTGPYFLQIFTSIYTVPLVIPAGSGTSFDFQVPFGPGTQYQICMVDSNGVSGGCQDIYTVIPNSTATAQNPATCTNVTLPTYPLQVDAAVITGAFSQYGWIPQCTDIQVQAKNGTGPYTLTVAPTLHPPLNITSNGGPINWTVSLTHGFPFFISVTDSQGNSWSQGPLHSGDNVDTSCLDTSHSGHKSSTVPAAIGAGVGGIVVGLLAGAFGILAFRRRGSRKEHREDLMRDSQLSSGNSQQSREVRATGGITAAGGLEYVVEPFAMPTTSPSSPPSDPGAPLLGGNPTSPTNMSRTDAVSTSGSSEPADPSGRRGTRNVYVVHHDGGRAPVTVYTDEGAEVVELPPRYPAGSTSTPSETRSASSRETDVNRRREPGDTRKRRESPRT